jgi:hypothetical protein
MIVYLLHRCVGRNRRAGAVKDQEAEPASETELIPRFLPLLEPVTPHHTDGVRPHISAPRGSSSRPVVTHTPTPFREIPTTEHLTAEQLALVDSMFIRNIPAPEIAAVIERMRVEREDRDAPPPAYGSN